jgi:NADH-quinone oxidoreductase subunit L
MGLCSFMLIGHWWEDGANSRAALKAFFTVRVGDTGLLIGIAILFFSSGTFSIEGINRWALQSGTSHQVLFWASISLFIAVIGKSGQFPLHTWLPDAMAGPTPVSSLLHSSTMVVAGVYLVARLYSVFYVGFHIADGGINPMALIGGITILISGVLALVQVDIKKVLAYSTVGQLGYMIMGLGVGAWTPAVFHIFTHAWFKACLFLAAGSVSHSASHHSFDMKKDMGGLRKKMPITFATFMISTIALCGIPPLAGFFSKDEIIDNAGHHGYVTFMVIGLIGAFMTAAYMARTIYLTFYGEPRGASAGVHEDVHADATVDSRDAHDSHAAHDSHDSHDAHGDAHAGPHESNWLITTPLVVLASLAVVAGWIGINTPALKFEKFAEWMGPRAVGGSFPFIEYGEAKWAKIALSVAVALAGLVIGFVVSRAVYAKKAWFGLTRRNPIARGLYAFAWNKYYLDVLYEQVIVKCLIGPIAAAAVWVNQHLLDGVVNGVGKASTRAGRWTYKYLDQGLVDGAVNGSASAAQGAGSGLRTAQTGKIQTYGVLFFGAAAIAVIALILSVQGK